MNKNKVDRQSFLESREMFTNPAEKVAANETQFQDRNNNSDSYSSMAGPSNGIRTKEVNILI